jgi:DNA topoisomerase-1
VRKNVGHFATAVYWDLEAKIKGEGREFIATLVRLGDQRIATGKDFDPQTGQLKNQNARLLGRGETGGAR